MNAPTRWVGSDGFEPYVNATRTVRIKETLHLIDDDLEILNHGRSAQGHPKEGLGSEPSRKRITAWCDCRGGERRNDRKADVSFGLA